MIEIVLAIMLFAVDLARLHVLRVFDAARFTAADLAVGARLLFHFFHPCLATLESGRFARRQGAGFFALLDTFLLIGLALFDPCLRRGRRGGLCESGNGGCEQQCGSEWFEIHVGISGVGGER